MKKIILILLVIYTNSFSLDFSNDTSKSVSTSKDKSFSEKQGRDLKNSETKKESNSETKDQSKSAGSDLTKIGQLKILKKIKELEKTNIEPFHKCEILSNPKFLIDFDISSQINEYTVNTTKQSILEKAARNSYSLKSVNANEKKLKSYMKCIAFYGAVIGQSLKTNEIDTEIEDEEILEILEDFTEDLKSKECKFISIDIFQCGSSKIKIDSEPILIYSNIPLFKDQTFFGYSLSSKNSISFSEKLSKDISRSKESSVTNSLSEDLSTNTKESSNLDKKTNTSLSVGKFIDIK